MASRFLVVTNSNLEAALVRFCLKRINFSFDQHSGQNTGSQIGLYGNRVHCSVSCKISSKNSNVIKIPCKDESGMTIRNDSQKFPL
jgi:hypothetical protein